MTAWQALTRQAYSFLKKSHGWLIDGWDRMRSISYCGTNLLRHGKTHEGRRRVDLDTVGQMPMSQWYSYEMVKHLSVTPEDMETMLGLSNTVGKIRFTVRRDPITNALTHIGFAQGHSDRTQCMINEDDMMTRVTIGDGRFADNDPWQCPRAQPFDSKKWIMGWRYRWC